MTEFEVINFNSSSSSSSSKVINKNILFKLENK